MNTLTNFLTTISPTNLTYATLAVAALFVLGLVLFLTACRKNYLLGEACAELDAENDGLTEELENLQNSYATAEERLTTSERRLIQLRKIMEGMGIDVVFPEDIQARREQEKRQPPDVDALLRTLFGNNIVDRYNAHCESKGEPGTLASLEEQAAFARKCRLEREESEAAGETMAPEFEANADDELSDAPDVAQRRSNGCCGGNNQCGG